MKPNQEIQLLQASLQGNTAAFEAIVKDYQPLVCGITYSALGDVAESEELAQQTFISAWKDLAQLRDLTKFKNWLCSIARNAVRNALRDKRRDPIRTAIPIDQIDCADAAAAEEAEAARTAERQTVVRQALGQIPIKYREPLVLFYRQDKSVKELAAQLELSENAVRQRLSRGRKLLREQVPAMVESTIAQTAPGKAFTAGVVAAIATLAVTGARPAAAGQNAPPPVASASAAPGMAGASSGVFGTFAAKIAAAAVIAAAGVSALLIHNAMRKQDSPPPPPTPSVTPAIFIQNETSQPAQATTPPIAVKYEKAEHEPARRPKTAESPQPMAAPPLTEKPPAQTADSKPVFQFAPQGLLSGVITDAKTGRPVADAKVEVTLRRRFEAVTDPNGFYHIDDIFEEGAHKIRIYSRQYLWVDNWNEEPSVMLKKDAGAIKHFVLERGCQVQVEVADPNGRPLKDVVPYITWMGQRYGRQTERSPEYRKTDADGRLLMGAYRPSETAYIVTAMHRDYAPAKCIVQLTDPNVIAPARIVMQPGTNVEGWATYADGQPAKDLKLTAQPKWWNITTCTPLAGIDETGAFTLPHIARDDYTIMVHIPNPDGGSISKSILETALPLSEGPLVLTIPGDSPTSLTAISGTIDFIDGTPSEDVRVSAYSIKTGPTDGRVTGNTFVIDRLKPGTYRLMFAGRNIESKTLTDISSPTENLKVQLKCLQAGAAPHLQGFVVNAATGKAIERFKARTRIVKSLTGSYAPAALNWQEFNDPEGRFAIEAPGGGVCQVQIAAEGLAWTWSDPIDTAAAQPVVVALSPGGIIKGRIVDRSGKPVSGAKVMPLSKAGGNLWFDQNTFTSAAGAVESTAGRFTLTDLGVPVETVKVTHSDYSPAIYENIKVASAETAEDVQLVLTRGGIVHGHVYDAQGKPQPNVLLNFQDAAGYRGASDAGRLAAAVTDKNGYYRVEHLPEQTCYVQRSEHYRDTGVVCRTVAPVNGKETTLDFGGPQVVTGRLLVDALPPAATELMLTDPYSSSALTFVSRVTTDNTGRFDFRGTPPGFYGLYYKLPQNERYTVPNWLKLTTLEVGPDDLDLGDMDMSTGRVALHLTGDLSNPSFKEMDVYLQVGTDVWGPKIGRVQPPANDGEPYIISGVPRGIYSIVLMRPDFVQFARIVPVESTDTDVEVTLDIPACTASVSGALTADRNEPVYLLSEDSTLRAYIPPKDDGAYAIANLPAGDYRIGGYYTVRTSAATRLTLSDGQAATLDVVSDFSSVNKGHLHMQAVDVDYMPIAANAWLEGPASQIEPYRIDDTGWYFATNPGQYTLVVSASGRRTYRYPISLGGIDLMAARAGEATLVVKFD
ncbi:MAG TPA: sigma-70 family RNA polymerase sigma factor [Anaerohalosphaeraceae bacterium]|nr:sigma-70 family RNA polymerase sigma factor [Anaerohalosphaeraceae bacterium]HRT50570.1 sigma-70 family RNA polymerase sigma factor [Anaerohalosphaeraceae bacterium]HRT86490.1 sigma-70 family RNA polymerase sigma factor [Anaerohalosphaeraceae bacterium]